MQTACYKLILFSCFLLAALASRAQSYHYYFGNIHAHTIYSDGVKDSAQTRVMTPADCYKFAKSAQHFDFLGISEHNHSGAKMHLSSYAKGLAQADAATENGKFVCLYGMEYGVINNGGHVVIYGFDKLIGWEHGNYDIFSEKSDYESLFKIIAKNPQAFATLAHPVITDYNQLISKPYDPVVDEAVTGVAVSSGPAFSKKTDYSDRPPLNYYSYYKKLLALGYIVGPVMDHDNHFTSFGRMSTTRTVLLSRELSRDSLIAAYKQNRFYASEDWDTQVDFTINSQPMGSYLVNSSVLQIKAVVLDTDVTDHVKTIKLWFGKPGSGELAKTLKIADRQNELSTVFNLQTGDDYYFFLEIIQEDGDRIITSPIWASHGSNSRSAIAMERFASAPPAMAMQPGPVNKIKTLLAQKLTRKQIKTHLNMNPQIIFWITFGLLTFGVAYCSRKYCMLKDSGKSARKPFSWSRVQLAWWTIILLSAFISVLFYYNQALTFSESAVILLGISAATTATARIIDVSDAENPSVTSRSQDTEGSNLVLDILSDKNGVSINRFQTVVFNFAFGCWFIYSILKNLTTLPEDGINAILPEISTNNLVLLGLSSATYAAMKSTENKATSPAAKDGAAAAPDSTNIEEQPVG